MSRTLRPLRPLRVRSHTEHPREGGLRPGHRSSSIRPGWRFVMRDGKIAEHRSARP
ncbi:unnamed protein product [[Actinomadura] parvosata subsp. kistnae]|nr:unnamed protein product [Actinomadura parvosata subsp. kistnae]